MAFRTSSFKRIPLTLIFGSCFFCSYSSNFPISTDSLDARKASAYLGFTPKDDSASVAYPNRFARGYNTQLPALIQGQMPGLNIYSTGEPGKSFDVYSRLFTSFSLPSVSFYVVDNMPIYGNVGFLNLDDIASISFVDGGTAASIYGERAANGAIVIKTKAATRSLKVTYSGSAAVSSVPKQVDVYSANEFKELVKVYAPSRVGSLGSANTSWQDAIYRSPLSHQHSVAISDSRYGIPFRASVGYADQQGVVKTTDYRKLTGAIIVSPSFFNDDLKVDAGVWLANEKNSPLMGVSNSIQPNPIENAIFFNPTYPVHEANSYGGYFCFKNSDGTPSMFPYNPVALLEQVDQSNKTSHINESIRATYRLPFLKALSFSAGLANVSSKKDQSRIVDSNTAWNTYRGSSSYNQNTDYDYTSWDLGASYMQEFAWLRSRIQATAGISRTNFSSSYSDELRYDAKLWDHNTLKGDSKDKATFARLSYSIWGRYQLELNVRDGKSSFFGKDVDIESYQVNGRWNVKNEPFLVNSTAISRLSVFASAGKTRGGADLAYPGSISFGIKPSTISNLRIGAELGLYENRASLAVAYSSNRVKDIITPVSMPYGTGYSTHLVNAGRLKSSNLELAAQALLIKSVDLSWHAGINLSYATNEVEEFSEGVDRLDMGTQVVEVGKPIGSFYVRKQVYDGSGKPIEGMYERLNEIGDNWDDYRAYKQPTPSTLMSFSSQLRYKSWDLVLQGRASLGNYVYNDVAVNSYYNKMKIWTFENVSKLASRANFVGSQRFSDFYVENGSFFRMEYISLGYTFGGKLRPHVSATVQNAFLVSGYSGVDPEVSSGRDNAGCYPRPRIISIGLELSL